MTTRPTIRAIRRLLVVLSIIIGAVDGPTKTHSRGPSMVGSQDDVSGQAAPVHPTSSDPRSTIDEVERRLIANGYNRTRRIPYAEPPRNRRIVESFLVPGKNPLSLEVTSSNSAERGAVSFFIRDGTGRSWMSVSGSSFDKTEVLTIAPGRYEVEIDLTKAQKGDCVWGMKGSVLFICGLDPAFRTVEAVPASGFHWPYILFVPKAVSRGRLLVSTANTGFASDRFEDHWESARCEAKRLSSLAERLECPLLLAVFPRPAVRETLYTHALDRDCLIEGAGPLHRLDVQAVAMIDDARRKLAENGVHVTADVDLYGFSASGMFVNRFAFLHPDRVHAIACGSPGGWPIVPVSSVAGITLRYPIGVSDIEALSSKPFDLQTLRSVAMFFFLGAEDENDSVVFRDGYEIEDEWTIMTGFGSTPVIRWESAEEIYRDAGLNARFVLYPKMGHRLSEAMTADVIRFFESTGGR